MTDFEQLGAFYLGTRIADGQRATDSILYDARDRTTHAVCVGMTGSGKTGLSVVTLEEAALDGIPAIVIDPKGDLSNLLLTFPSLVLPVGPRVHLVRSWLGGLGDQPALLPTDHESRGEVDGRGP